MAETVESAEAKHVTERDPREFLIVELHHAYESADGDLALAFRFLQHRALGMEKQHAIGEAA